MKKIIWVIVIVALVGFIFISATDRGSDEKVRIGFVGPFTGNSAAFGEFMQNGFDLALAELTPVQLANLEIIKEDDTCSGKNAVSAVQKLIEVDRVNYVIGPLCNESSLATEKMFEDNEVLSLTIGLPSNTIANMGPYHFSFSPEIEYLMKTIATEIGARGLKRIAVIHIISTFEDENYRHFMKYLPDAGGEIVADEGVIKGATDFRNAVLKVKESNPEALMLVAVTGELNNILKQLHVQGLGDLPKFGIHAAETAVILQESGIAEGLVYPYPGDRAEVESARTFAELYNGKYGSSPNPYSANAYDSLKILLAAIDDCGYSAKECVRGRLAGLKGYAGANGNLSVDNRGVGTYKEIMLKVVRDGKFEILPK